MVTPLQDLDPCPEDEALQHEMLNKLVRCGSPAPAAGPLLTRSGAARSS